MASLHSGLFITVEGIDGAGKSTHLPLIDSILTEAGYKVLRTREPGGTPAGDQLRHFLLESHLTPESELLLMFAARQEHLQHFIRPALAEKHCVLCDRFTDSSYAYQGGGRGLDENVIQHLEDWLQQGLSPDLTLYFDLPVEISMERCAKRQSIHPVQDRFEEESEAFFTRVRQAYLDRVRKQPHRFYVIDGADTIENIQGKLDTFLRDWLHYFMQSSPRSNVL